MKNLIKISFFLGVVILVLTSCHFNSWVIDSEEDKRDAEKTTNKLFDLLKKKRYEETTTLFSKNFFEYTSKEKLVKLFSVTNKKLGQLEEIKLNSWETRVVKGSDPSANYVLIYRNRYEKFQATETLQLIKEKDGNIRIMRYRITSDGFLTQ